MAPESVLDRKYSLKSDVWSFGVLLWEIFSIGNQPYSGMSAESTISAVARGHRMERPEMCPDDMYALMLDDW